MKREELYLGTINELKNRLESGGNYNILMTAGLLRKLLLDEEPLLSIIKRGRQRRIWFTIGDAAPPTGAIVWSLLDGLSPQHAVNPLSTKQVTIDQFLSTV